MQLLDEHLWKFYDEGKITLEEMLDKARQPGMLQDKVNKKIKQMSGAKGKSKKDEMKDMGQILRT